MNLRFLSLAAVLLLNCSLFANTYQGHHLSPAFNQHFLPLLNVGALSQDQSFPVLERSGGFFIGNGGNSVSCPGPADRLLDLAEGEQVFSYELINSLNSSQVMDLVTKRLSVIAPIQSAELAVAFKNFNTYTAFTDRLSIAPIGDQGVVLIDSNCTINQLAVQFQNPGDNPVDQKRLLISRSYWSQLNDFHRVGLIAHEHIAAKFFAVGFRDTFYTRRLVALIFSDQFAQAVERVKHLNLKERRHIGVLLHYNYRLFKQKLFGFDVELTTESFSNPETITMRLLGPTSFKMADQYYLYINSKKLQTFNLAGIPKHLHSLGRADDYIRVKTLKGEQDLDSYYLKEMFFEREQLSSFTLGSLHQGDLLNPGGPQNFRAHLTNIYQNFLLRAPESEEIVQYWQRYFLTKGGTNLIITIATIDEANRMLTDADFVRASYKTFLAQHIDFSDEVFSSLLQEVRELGRAYFIRNVIMSDAARAQSNGFW